MILNSIVRGSSSEGNDNIGLIRQLGIASRLLYDAREELRKLKLPPLSMVNTFGAMGFTYEPDAILQERIDNQQAVVNLYEREVQILRMTLDG